MATPSEEELRDALASVLLKDGSEDEGVVDGIDGDIISYLAGMLHDSGLEDAEGTIEPFLTGYGCDDDLVKACGDAVMQCGNSHEESDRAHIQINGGGGETENAQQAVKLKQGMVSMSSALTDQSEAEVDHNRFMWGQDK